MNENEQGKFVMPGDLILNEERNLEGTYTDNGKVANVDEVKNALLAEPRKLIGGEIIEVEPVKIPRIIGRNSSMVSMIKQYTKCEVTVGKNGRIHLKGGDSAKALSAIVKICKESHTSGLTDRIKQYLEQ